MPVNLLIPSSSRLLDRGENGHLSESLKLASQSSKLSRAYAKFIDQTIIDHVGDAGTNIVELDEVQRAITANGAFITFGFYDRRQGTFSNRANSDNPLMIKLDHLYNLVCRKLIGPRYAARTHEQPLCIAALDINSTRYFRAPSEVRNPHLHTIWITRPGQTELFFSFMRDVEVDARYSSFGFKEVDIRRITEFDLSHHECSVLGSYTAKFLGRNTRQMLYADDFRIYPTRPLQIKKDRFNT